MNCGIDKVVYLFLGTALLASCSSSKSCEDFVRDLNRQANIEKWKYEDRFSDTDRSCRIQENAVANSERKSMNERNLEEYCRHYPENIESYNKRCR